MAADRLIALGAKRLASRNAFMVANMGRESDACIPNMCVCLLADLFQSNKSILTNLEFVIKDIFAGLKRVEVLMVTAVPVRMLCFSELLKP